MQNVPCAVEMGIVLETTKTYVVLNVFIYLELGGIGETPTACTWLLNKVSKKEFPHYHLQLLSASNIPTKPHISTEKEKTEVPYNGEERRVILSIY